MSRNYSLLFNIRRAYASCFVLTPYWHMQNKSSDRNDSRLRTLFSEAVLPDQQLITHRNIVVIEWNEKKKQISFFRWNPM